MPSAEIITIGTELLLGEIINTNTQVIALAMRDIGVDVYRTSTIGDNQSRISQIIQESISRANIVITTGGLGPTVDDPTRQAIAQAFDLELIFKPELWREIVERFKRFGKQPSDNNRQQAFIPEGGDSLPNAHGTAPGIYLKSDLGLLFALPGVPNEMQGMLKDQVVPKIREHFSLTGVILTRSIRVEGIGESQVDSIISDLETLSNPTVGLAAGKGHVLVRMTAKAPDENEAAALIKDLENKLLNLLEDWVVPEKR
jgi:competence/damage-inducible protein CinA-like protein